MGWYIIPAIGIVALGFYVDWRERRKFRAHLNMIKPNREDNKR